MPEKNIEIIMDGVSIILVRKRIKHSYLRVKDDGSVLMTVNHRLNQNQIQTILVTHLPKLKPKINQLQLNHAKKSQPITQIQFLGNTVPLESIYSPSNHGHELRQLPSSRGSNSPLEGCQPADLSAVDGVDALDSSIIQHKINLWYKKQAKTIFAERFELGLKSIHAWNVNAPKLCIRDMKTRWGSYSRSTHRVSLSLWLIKMPVELIDYVIAHELTHIIHFNHSQDFYSLLATLCPEWKQNRTTLRHLAYPHTD